MGVPSGERCSLWLPEKSPSVEVALVLVVDILGLEAKSEFPQRFLHLQA